MVCGGVWRCVEVFPASLGSGVWWCVEVVVTGGRDGGAAVSSARTVCVLEGRVRRRSRPSVCVCGWWGGGEFIMV